MICWPNDERRGERARAETVGQGQRPSDVPNRRGLIEELAKFVYVTIPRHERAVFTVQLAQDGQIGRFAERALWNIDSGSASLRLDVSSPNHLGPFVGVFDD